MLRKWQLECISSAIKKYSSGQKHFLTQATPAAGKTIMSAHLSKQLLEANMIDLVICFSPSVNVAAGFTSTFSRVLQCSFNGQIGTTGTSITYQAIQHIDNSFWTSISKYRVFAIFDEIHHCAGQTQAETNSWGEQIIAKIQSISTFTLALTGTPWRSDCLPISLSPYSDPDRKIICDYQYSLKQAISDNVCRKPKIVLVDNEQLQFTSADEHKSYASIQALFKEEKISYNSILQDENALLYILKLATNKLQEIRHVNYNAAGLVVASSIAHAHQIQKILFEQLQQTSNLVSYLDPDAQSTIEAFKQDDSPWIISIGMISEGTDIPRLQVCCHLSNVRTELYFRQVLGRILRVTDGDTQDAWFYTFAEQNLTTFAEQIEQDIPDTCLYLKQPKSSFEAEPSQSEEYYANTGSQQNIRSEIDWINKQDAIVGFGNAFGTFTLGKFKERIIEAFQGA